MITTKGNLNLENIHNGRAPIPARLYPILHLSISLRNWRWSVLKQIMDIILDALSGAHEYPFYHVITIKMSTIQHSWFYWHLDK